MPRAAVPLPRTAQEEAGLAERPARTPRPRRHRLQLLQQTCFEQGDFFGLDDLFTEKPVVVNGLAQIYADWITRTSSTASASTPRAT